MVLDEALGFFDEDEVSSLIDDDEIVSSIWDGELRDATEVLSNEDIPLLPVQAWSVKFSPRVAVRSRPSLDGTIIAVRREGEIVFTRDEEKDGWLKLADGDLDQTTATTKGESARENWMLRDGSIKGLGVLLEPLDFSPIPKDYRPQVIELLMAAWTRARLHTNGCFQDGTIPALREAYDKSVEAAKKNESYNLLADGIPELEALGFDIVCFESEFDGMVSGALAMEKESYSSKMLDVKAAPVSSLPPGDGHRDKPWSYGNPRIDPSGLPTAEFATELQQAQMEQTLLRERDLCELLRKAAAVLDQLPTMTDVAIPSGGMLHIVGDLHGQYFDLVHILESSGEPGPNNLYIFNGDFVDRGAFSVEIAILLLTLKLTFPTAVHLNRGNHETGNMNSIYGFRSEVIMKYSVKVFDLFSEAFRRLPLATLINERVLVLHGGLSRRSGVLLRDIKMIQRQKEPSDMDELMMDLLWSDPGRQPGCSRSPRGAGVLFGPDVTNAFCELNGLACIVRSHEVKDAGYEWNHERCLTVFSAANYCGVHRNLGAVIDIEGPVEGVSLCTSDLKPRTFTAAPVPPTIPPTARSFL